MSDDKPAPPAIPAIVPITEALVEKWTSQPSDLPVDPMTRSDLNLLYLSVRAIGDALMQTHLTMIAQSEGETDKANDRFNLAKVRTVEGINRLNEFMTQLAERSIK